MNGMGEVLRWENIAGRVLDVVCVRSILSVEARTFVIDKRFPDLERLIRTGATERTRAVLDG